MPGKKILVIGSANIDFLMTTPYIPQSGETLVSGGSYSFVPGGKGANAAVAAARIGGDIIFCARVGDDAYGDRLRRIYAEAGIDLRNVRVDKSEQTGLAVVLLEKSAANRIIVYPGANKNLGTSDIEAAFTAYPDMVLANMELDNDAIYSLSAEAADKSLPLILDCGGVNHALQLAKIKQAEILSPNEIETEVLTGIRPDSLDNCLRACIKLFNTLSLKYVVLKLGGRGSYIYDGKYCDICGPYEVNAVDTTAAGDAFTAALAVEYARTGDVHASCKYANAVGALAVTKIGAISSLPTADEVTKFMAERKQI